MSFLDDVVRARALLAETGRVSARALRRQFELDDDGLEELIEELVDVQRFGGHVAHEDDAERAVRAAEDHDLPDLVDAKALLDSLGG